MFPHISLIFPSAVYQGYHVSPFHHHILLAFHELTKSFRIFLLKLEIKLMKSYYDTLYTMLRTILVLLDTIIYIEWGVNGYSIKKNEQNICISIIKISTIYSRWCLLICILFKKTFLI